MNDQPELWQLLTAVEMMAHRMGDARAEWATTGTTAALLKVHRRGRALHRLVDAVANRCYETQR